MVWRPQRGGNANARQAVAAGPIICAFSGWEEGNGAGLRREGHNVLGEHGAAAATGTFEMDADEEVVVASTQRAGQVRVLQGVQQLGLVHVAAQSMRHAVVAQGTHCAVEAESVGVEPLQVQALRQLQDVHAPAKEMGHRQRQSGKRRRETETRNRERERGGQVSGGGPSALLGQVSVRSVELGRRSLSMVLEIPMGSEGPLRRPGTLAYLRRHREDLVTLSCIWDPWIGPEPHSGRSSYPGYI